MQNNMHQPRDGQNDSRATTSGPAIGSRGAYTESWINNFMHTHCMRENVCINRCMHKCVYAIRTRSSQTIERDGQHDSRATTCGPAIGSTGGYKEVLINTFMHKQIYA